jgi:hypothetical protein
MLVFIALVVWLLMYVNERDQRRDAIKKMNESSTSEPLNP